MYAVRALRGKSVRFATHSVRSIKLVSGPGRGEEKKARRLEEFACTSQTFDLRIENFLVRGEPLCYR